MKSRTEPSDRAGPSALREASGASLPRCDGRIAGGLGAAEDPDGLTQRGGAGAVRLRPNPSYRHPFLAIDVSAVAGLIAHTTKHDGWAVLFVCFLSYMLIWYDETRHPRAAEQGSVGE